MALEKSFNGPAKLRRFYHDNLASPDKCTFTKDQKAIWKEFIGRRSLNPLSMIKKMFSKCSGLKCT